MIVKNIVFYPDGTEKENEIEVPDDYFSTPAPAPTLEERITALELLQLSQMGVTPSV